MREFVAPNLLRVSIPPIPEMEFFEIFKDFDSTWTVKAERYGSNGTFIEEITKVWASSNEPFLSSLMLSSKVVCFWESTGTTSMTIRTWDLSANALAGYTYLRRNGQPTDGNRGLSRPYLRESDGKVYWVEGSVDTGSKVVWTLRRSAPDLSAPETVGSFELSGDYANAFTNESFPPAWATADKVHFPMREDTGTVSPRRRWISFNWDGTGGESVARPTYTSSDTPLPGATLPDGRCGTVILGGANNPLESIGNDFRTDPNDAQVQWATPTPAFSPELVSVVDGFACVGVKGGINSTAFFLIGDPDNEATVVQVDLVGGTLNETGWTFLNVYAVPS